MNDLEICKCIAEIEKINMYETEYAIYNMDDLVNDGQCRLPAIYNPLTDDALCFKLMVKHNVIFAKGDLGGKFITQIKPFDHQADSSPNKAICLAIIGAHNDN